MGGGGVNGEKEGRPLNDAWLSDGWEVDSSKTCWQIDENDELERLSLRTLVERGGKVVEGVRVHNVDAKNCDDNKHNQMIRYLSFGFKSKFQ